MKTLRWRFPAALAAMLLFVPACVELTRQRITWFYDAAQDTLHFLIHYDGIHETDTSPNEGLFFRRTPRKGAEQIPKFVDNGDVMLFDWPFHLDRNRVRENTKESSDPLIIEVAELSRAVETRNLGHYREPDGRIGAAQLVSIPQAAEFVAQLNHLISRALLQEREPDPPDLPRTLRKLWEAAERDHQWVALAGHSIRVSIPVHPAEWAQAKAYFVEDLFGEVIEDIEDPDEDGESVVTTLVRLLGSAPISYIDEGDRVTFVLGRPDQPSTLRIAIREAYEPSLEEVVTKSIPLDLDQALARVLVDADQALPELAPLLAWGPRENQVRALLASASGADAEERRAIAERLARWGARWNREQGVPVAPMELDPDEIFAHWASWYQQVVNPGR